MTDGEKVNALIDHCGLHPHTAAYVLRSLEQMGYTIYRKKIPRAERRPAASKTMTPALRAAIRATHKAHPDKTQQQIAEMHQVNIGRVSEALR